MNPSTRQVFKHAVISLCLIGITLAAISVSHNNDELSRDTALSKLLGQVVRQGDQHGTLRQLGRLRTLPNGYRQTMDCWYGNSSLLDGQYRPGPIDTATMVLELTWQIPDGQGEIWEELMWAGTRNNSNGNWATVSCVWRQDIQTWAECNGDRMHVTRNVFVRPFADSIAMQGSFGPQVTQDSLEVVLHRWLNQAVSLTVQQTEPADPISGL